MGGTSTGRLRQCISSDTGMVYAHVELQVLGLLGKLLTGLWMKEFYQSARDQIGHERIKVVKEVLCRLREMKGCAMELLTVSKDFLGVDLKVEEGQKLREKPKDESLFGNMLEACLGAVIGVIERQYKRYFGMDLDERLQDETKTARLYNIDAEEMIGMFSAMQAKAPNATICYLSCKMRSRKNGTVGYLDGLSMERRDEVLRKAVQLEQKQRRKRRMNEKELRAEVLRRVQEKRQAREMTDRRRVERKLKTATMDTLASDSQCEVVCLEIQGILLPPKGSTIRENTNELVLKVGNVMGVQINKDDISVSHRLPMRQLYKGRRSVPAIIVKFVRCDTKELFYQARKKLKDFTTCDLGFPDGNNIFISESLTEANKELFKAALKFRNEYSYDFI